MAGPPPRLPQDDHLFSPPSPGITRESMIEPEGIRSLPKGIRYLSGKSKSNPLSGSIQSTATLPHPMHGLIHQLVYATYEQFIL